MMFQDQSRADELPIGSEPDLIDTDQGPRGVYIGEGPELVNPTTPTNPISIAPMIGWTDRNWRFLFRQIAREPLLYTEMVMDSAVLYNTHCLDDHIGFDRTVEPPLALQLGGNDPETLGRAVDAVETYSSEGGGGFSEINLNAGCPSNKAKRAGFGAELMQEPELVRQICSSMVRRSRGAEVTVKCRIGTDRRDSWADLLQFVHACRDGGVRRVVVHSRICVMCGLSPAQNRSVPPLRYDAVHRLAGCFPDMRFVLNGGLHCCDDFDAHLGTGGGHIGGGGYPYPCEQWEQWEHFPEKLSLPPPSPPSSSSSSGSGSVRLWPPVQGVMVGREAYHNPWAWADVDRRYYGTANPCVSRREALLAYIDYAETVLEGGRVRSSLPYLVKPLHNFFSGCPTNKQYKQRLDGLVKEHADRTGTGGTHTGGMGGVGCMGTHVGAGRTGLTLTEVVLEAVRLIPPSFLDARMGQGGQMVSDGETYT